MFFDEYPKDKLTCVWREFAKIKQSYAPEGRWSEIVDKSYRNAPFTVLTMDNIIYNFYKNTYTEEDEQNYGPFLCTAMMIILAKKTTIDYGVEMNIPDYEFSTYFQSTRLSTIFERTREFSEQMDDFTKYEGKIKEMFPDDEITLWRLFNEPELVTEFGKICDDTENYGITFIDTFTNILTYDFVRNYMNLPNERNLNDIYSEEYAYYGGQCCSPKDVTGCETESQTQEPCDSGN